MIASGRSFSTLPEDVIRIPGIQYAITSNGAAVYTVPDGQCLQRFYLSEKSVLEILRLTEREAVVYEAFIDGIAFADEAYVRDPVRFGATAEAVSYVQSTRKLIFDMPAFIRAHANELESVDIVTYDEQIKSRIWEKLQTFIPDIYITSSVPQLIEIAHRRAGKHSGLRYIAELLRLPREGIAAFGDGDNDQEMLKWAGCGIAVANATRACLAAADRVTSAHDADGVAEGIYALLSDRDNATMEFPWQVD